MVFRKAKKEEAERILALYRSVTGSEFCVWNEEYPGEKEIAADMECGNLFVLMDGSRMVGAASVVPENELDDLDLWKDTKDAGKKVGEIARVVIAPEYQGRGLAKTLVASLEKVMRERGYGAVRLLAAVKNTPAYRTYLDRGFQIAGECDRYDDHYYACEKILSEEKDHR